MALNPALVAFWLTMHALGSSLVSRRNHHGSSGGVLGDLDNPISRGDGRSRGGDRLSGAKQEDHLNDPEPEKPVTPAEGPGTTEVELTPPVPEHPVDSKN